MKLVKSLLFLYFVCFANIVIGADDLVTTSVAISGFPEADLVFIADTNHDVKKIRDGVGLALEALSAVQFNCLFLEADRSFQQSIDDFLSGSIDFETLNREIKSKSNGMERALSEKLMTKAVNEGFNVFLADIDWKAEFGQTVKAARITYRESLDSESAFKKDADLVITERNQKMMEVINHHHQTGVCNRSVYIVGKAHVENERKSVKNSWTHPVTSLTQLASEKYKPIVVGTLPSWNECPAPLTVKTCQEFQIQAGKTSLSKEIGHSLYEFMILY